MMIHAELDRNRVRVRKCEKLLLKGGSYFIGIVQFASCHLREDVYNISLKILTILREPN